MYTGFTLKTDQKWLRLMVHRKYLIQTVVRILKSIYILLTNNQRPVYKSVPSSTSKRDSEIITIQEYNYLSCQKENIRLENIFSPE